MSRRQFLKSSLGFGAGLLLPEVIALYRGVEHGILKQAFAASGDASARNYINLHLSGAPGRWTFDQWLTPNLTDPTLSPNNPSTWNPGVATAFDAGVATYPLMTVNGVRVPALFASTLTAPTGTRLMSDLLKNMAVVRGYNSSTDGHEINGPLQTFPDPAVPSLAGLAADNRKDSIAAVAMDFATHPFKSGSGKVLSTITSHYGAGRSIGSLMAAFKRSAVAKPGLLKMDEIRTVIDTLYQQSRAIAMQSNGRSGALVEQLKSARDLATLAAQDLATQANTLFTKYQTIMNGSVRTTMSMAGFSEAPNKFAAGESRQSQFLIDANYDLRESVLRATMPDQLILSFMLAEYCLTRGVTGSLMLGNGSSVLWNIDVVKDGETAKTAGMAISADQHGEPARMATIANAASFRGISAGLLELISVLKGIPIVNGGNAFDQTVIHITGDFGRSPQTNVSANGKFAGSDHGFDAQVSSVFSGCIDGPLIVGNITAAGKTNYAGTWGVSAPVDFNGSSEVLSPRHAAAAVAHLIGASNPWPFTHLVWEIGPTGKLQRKIEAKII